MSAVGTLIPNISFVLSPLAVSFSEAKFSSYSFVAEEGESAC